VARPLTCQCPRAPWPHGAHRPDDGVARRHDIFGEDAPIGLRLPPRDGKRSHEFRVRVQVLGLLAGEEHPLQPSGERRPMMRRGESQQAAHLQRLDAVDPFRDIVPCQSIAYIFVGAFALLTLAFLVVLAPLIWMAALHFAPGLEPLNRLITFGRFAIASSVLLLALVLAHKFLPAGRRSLRDIAPGILLTSAMWIAAGIAFGSFLAEYARNYVTTYAGLASVMIALVFLYMIASIFIFGGELNAAILRAKRKRNGNLKVERAMRGSW
jgi:Virulence factor BrkB